MPAGTPTGVCANLIGTTLAASGSAGDSVTCQFSGTAPTTNGASITDTVTVVVNQPGNPGNTTTGNSTSTVLTPPTVGITKANNAAGTGYGPSEIATDGETSVPYQVVVTNTNSSPGTITVLTDTVDGSTTNICPTDVGLVLAAGASVTCDFTGPVPTTATTDTAGVTLSVNDQMVSGTATSTVFPPVLGVTITKKPPTTVPTVPSSSRRAADAGDPEPALHGCSDQPDGRDCAWAGPGRAPDAGRLVPHRAAQARHGQERH